MKQPARHRVVDTGDAIVPFSSDQISTEFQLFFAVVDKSAYEQIEPSIVVVVEPYCACRPPRRGNACLGSHVGKGAVSVVVVENAVGILRNVQVRKSIPVIITNCHTHSVGVALYARMLGHISKSAVAIVVIQSVAQWW